MANSTLIVLFVGLIGLSVLAGALATWLVLRFLPGKRSVTKEFAPPFVEEEEPSQSTVVDPAQDRPIPIQEAAPILSVQRDRGGELGVYVRGERYGRLEEIADAHTGRDALEATKAVLQFADRWLASAHRPVKQAIPKESTLTAEKFLEDLERDTRFVTGIASASITADRVLLAEQIDRFVQKRLRRLPELADLHVKLGSSANAALFIRVGSDTYDSIDAIPNGEVREIIREAIRDWEGE